MKMSLCQMIAIVCILAVGIMTVTPFVQTGHTDGKAHNYVSGHTHLYSHHYCQNGHLLSVGVVSTDGIQVSRHKDGESHKPFRLDRVIVITNSGAPCSICHIVYLPHITSS